MTTFQDIAYNSIEEFETAFSYNAPDETRIKLIEEELTEWRQAFSDFLKETADVLYVVAGASRVGLDLGPELYERICEFIGVTAAIDELNPGITHEVFKRVHESNMSKLGDDGLPVRREDGKVLKGPNYKPPYLMDLVPAGPVFDITGGDYYAGA